MAGAPFVRELVSQELGILALIKIESRRGAVAWAVRQRSVPLPAHQTGRADFRRPAFRLDSSQGTRQKGSAFALQYSFL
jgi:hypothetical protein